MNVVRPGERVTIELKIYDNRGNPQPYVSATWAAYDRSNASVTAGEPEYESDGTYLISWTVPPGAVRGHTYLIEVSVVMAADADPEMASIPLLVGGPTV